MLASYVATLVWMEGGFEAFWSAAEREACELIRQGMTPEEVLEYILIGVARGLASEDSEEMRSLLAEADERAEMVVEKVAEKAHELLRSQSPRFYRSIIEFIRSRCKKS